MTNTDQSGGVNKIVFFHMNQLGDLLFSLPLLSAARKQWPDKRLFSIVRPEFVTLLQATGLVDTVVPRPRSSLNETLNLLKWLKSKQFGHAVLFSESPKAILLAKLSGIPIRTGFSTASLGFLLTEKAQRSGVPSIANNTQLAKRIGLDFPPLDYSGLIKIPAAEQDRARSWLAAHRLAPRNFVVVAPGASKRRSIKCWPDARWKELLSRMLDKGIQPVLVGAPSERTKLEQMSLQGGRPCSVFIAPDGILQLAALLEQSKLFLGIDSGAMHLAAALKIPAIALFGPTDPKQIGPQPLYRHRIIKKAAMNDISLEDVWNELNFQLPLV